MSSNKESLILKMLNRGSGENLRTIFQQLSSLKDKIRIERVCQAFKYHVNSKEAWSNVKTVEIGGGDEWSRYEINGEHVHLNQFAMAVNSVFLRSHNLGTLNLSYCANSTAYSLIAECIMHFGAAHFQKMEHLKFRIYGSFDITTYIILVVNLFNAQLTTLDFCNYNISFDEQVQFWKSIGNCSKLMKIICHTTRKKADSIISNLVKEALCNKPIEFLHLNTYDVISSDDLFEIITSRSRKRSMTYMAIHVQHITLIDIFHKIPDDHWIGLQEFSYSFYDSFFDDGLYYDDPNWAIAKKLPRMLPQLIKLGLTGALASHRETTKLIVSYISLLNENERAPRSLILRLSFASVYDSNGWKRVYQMLRDEYRCEIEYITAFRTLIHRREQGNASIVIPLDYRKRLHETI